MPQQFRARSRPQAGTVVRPPEPSSAARGYDSKWRRYSEVFRRKNPFCARCRESGRMTLIVTNRSGVVDHKAPVKHGGDFWDPKNHWGLCTQCHGWKARLEEHWKEIGGTVEQIIRWCDEPETRPVFRGDLECAVAKERRGP